MTVAAIQYKGSIGNICLSVSKVQDNVFLSFFILQTVCLVGIAVSTFFFTLVWQFAQFILLLESMAFFGTYSLGFIPKYKVRSETGKAKLLKVAHLALISQIQVTHDRCTCSYICQ